MTLYLQPNNLKKVLIFSLMLLVSQISFGQRLSIFKVPKFKRDHTLNYVMGTAGFGMSNYFGDVCADFSCWTFQPSASLGGYFRYNERFAFRAEFYWTRLRGADKVYSTRSEDPRWGRNATFRTDIAEFSVTAMYDIFDFNPNYAKRAPLEPYLLLGIGFLYYNPMSQIDNKGEFYNLRQYKTEGVSYSQFAMSFPIGVGCRFKITDKFNLGVEIGYRVTTTDYLDDISNKYKSNLASVTDPTEKYFSDRTGTHVANEIRGNPNNRDGYIVYSIRAEYLLFVTKQLFERGKNINADVDPRYKKRQIRRR